MTVSPARYVSVCRVALGLLCAIVITGAAVRLTGSGLGCSDWPRCNEDRFIDVSSTHGAIEQVNRLFTGLVSVGVILAVLGAHFRSPRRRDLVRLSWGLVVGVVGQVVLGGIVVLTDLHPVANQGHFILSMILVTNAVVLLRAAQRDDGAASPTVSPGDRRLAWTISSVSALAIVTGTVVTGSGPHAGDENAKRFPFEIETVARIHGVTVVVTLATMLFFVVRLKRSSRLGTPVGASLEAVLALGLIQGVVGYTQYFSGIPALLVGIHIGLATLLFAAVVNLHLTATGRV